MLGAEINTAVHYQLPILFVVFNNGMHGMCVTRQQLYFGGPHRSVAVSRDFRDRHGPWFGFARPAVGGVRGHDR